MTKLRSTLEEKVVAAVNEGRDELVELVASLVAFDTTARDNEEPAREEEALQRLLAARLTAIGAETDLWEPPNTGTGNRHVPDDLDFKGRPQLAAWLRGAGGTDARSLLLNGHIDAVDVEPRDKWSSDPFSAIVRDGKLYGRGVNDMKGGIAAYLFAVETLRRLGVKLAGDLCFCTVTDEESSGAGGFAAVARGVKADAGLIGEPTGFDAWVSCRGSLTPNITVEGRAGHAEMAQPHWSAGGAVNAIDKMRPVLDEVRAVREDWLTRPDQQHPLLSPGTIVPTIIKGGTWDVTYPASCELTCELMYLPTHVDEQGTGRRIEREVQERIERAVAADPWFAEHPLRWFWDTDVVPGEIPADHPLVGLTLEAAAGLGHAGGKPDGFDSWHDAATFTRSGTPTFSFGPGGAETAHAVDEYTPVQDLIDVAAIVAVTAMRWCGVVE